MVKIAISGASGKMGRTLIRHALRHDDVTLSEVVDHPNSDALGKDVAELVGLPKSGVIIAEKLRGAKFDVLIDFTRPEATLAYAGYCHKHHKSLVVGTTGFSDSQIVELQQKAQDISIVLAPNMSVGVNLSFKLMEMAAQVIGRDCDIEIIEAHHKHKVDAPSGTALAMGEIIAKQLNTSLNEDGVFTRHGYTGVREDGKIGFSVIRAGDIVGEHTALFGLEGERIEISHKATSRDIYANGAFRAAKWVVGQSNPGLFSMQNVLGFS